MSWLLISTRWSLTMSPFGLGGIKMLEFECPRCRARSPYVAELVGREIFCLGCGAHILVPNLEPKESSVPGTEASGPIVVDFTPPITKRKSANSGDGPLTSND